MVVMSRSGSTTQNVLERRVEVGPQPARPVAEMNGVQAERQQRRKRGLNLGCVDQLSERPTRRV